MGAIPKDYDKYDDETQDALGDLLFSIDHIVHVVNGIRDDIMNGNYDATKAEVDYDSAMFVEGLDLFSALQRVAEAAWDNESDMRNDKEIVEVSDE
jgi:hypothetical protein